MTYAPLDLAAAFIQTGELNDALDALNRHLDAQPDDNHARRLRIGVCKHLGGADNLNTALADFERLTDPAPDDAIQLSVLLEQAGQDARALEALARAHGRWPDYERLTERYLHLLLAQGRADDALPVIRQQPGAWRWLQWEGDALAAQGDDLTATARYGLALAQLEHHLTPDNARYFAPIRARLLLARAAAYRRTGLLDLAGEHYSAAGQIMPDDPTIKFNQGLIHWLRGEPDDALALCRAALDTASEQIRAHLLDELRADPQAAGLLIALTPRA